MNDLKEQGTDNSSYYATAVILLLSVFGQAVASPSLTIPQVPLIMTSPTHPQVLIGIGNSQSMDGNLSGAIMTGSGSVATAFSSLNNSSSPLTYLVPTGFTPPVQGADGSGFAPFTVLQSLALIDNSASRLNVAKLGVQALLDAYMGSTDFALAAYTTSGATPYTTWVYYMSPTGANFSFTNTQVAGNRYVTNPCYNYLTASTTVRTNCTSIATLFGATTLSSNQFMQIGASSDDPNINDVLYAPSNFPGVLLTYSGPSPASPFPPSFSLTNYNNGGVSIAYSRTLPNIGGFSSSPTNAGYVPFSPQVLYARRGFGFYGSQTANSGTILVPMTTAGTSPTQATVDAATNLFIPFLNPERNSSSSTEIKSVATQSPMAGLLTRANTYMSALGTTSGTGCPQKKYVILISDGLPTQDLNGKFWPPLGSASATGYGVTATFNADGSLNTTNCQSLTDAISAIKTLKDNDINTYIIGLGAGVDPSANPQAAATLKAMAVAGGTSDYYPAISPQALVDDLNMIMVAIQNGSYQLSASTVSSTRLSTSTVIYQANFISNDVPYQDWTGNLNAIDLDDVTGVPTSTINWSARSLLDTMAAGSGWSNRVIATWNPTANDGVAFRWSAISAAQQVLLQPTDSLGERRLEYLRGNSTYEIRNGGTFRNRSHILGDIMDSQVISVAAPRGPYLSASYVAFANAQINRTPLLLVGANDGMLHAFNATTGAELFGFIPNAVFSNLSKLTASLYNVSHLYFVNGSPQSGDVQFSDSSWHTLVVGGENGGGNSIFALDVTSAANYASESSLANSVLWEFTDLDMGLSYSTPQIAQITSTTASPLRFAVFFGNGYNSATNKSVFYAINPETGAVLRKIDLCALVPSACDATKPQGLSSVAVGQIDGLQAQPITAVYAGDLQGNLWSINVSDPSPANWSARLLFQATDANGLAQPITTPPVVTLHPSYPRLQGMFVMFGTGQLLTSNDLSDKQRQTVYGVWDNPLSSATYTRANLQQQTLTLIPASGSISVPLLTSTANAVNWTSTPGWYNDLINNTGQRIITNPDLLNGAFIATLNTPPASTCSAGFTSMLLELNFATGGAFLRPIFDVNGDGGFTNSDQYNGVNPVGIGLKPGYATAPTLFGGIGNGNNGILTNHPDGQTSFILNPNLSPRKIGWWQLQ